jgi:hypothetical protein
MLLCQPAYVPARVRMALTWHPCCRIAYRIDRQLILGRPRGHPAGGILPDSVCRAIEGTNFCSGYEGNTPTPRPGALRTEPSEAEPRGTAEALFGGMMGEGHAPSHGLGLKVVDLGLGANTALAHMHTLSSIRKHESMSHAQPYLNTNRLRAGLAVVGRAHPPIPSAIRSPPES